jgi:predicted GNAT family acetyltransferase
VALEDTLAGVQPAESDQLDIVDDREARRWQAFLDDRVVGYAEYRLSQGRVIFTHTVVEPEHEGRGIAGRLARAALDDAIGRGLRITPYCPYIRAYLRRHPEYDAQVDLPRPPAGR